MGAFSPPLRLTGKQLDAWAAKHCPADDDLLAPAAQGELIHLRPPAAHRPRDAAETRGEETPLRRVRVRRGTR